MSKKDERIYYDYLKRGLKNEYELNRKILKVMDFEYTRESKRENIYKIVKDLNIKYKRNYLKELKKYIKKNGEKITNGPDEELELLIEENSKTYDEIENWMKKKGIVEEIIKIDDDDEERENKQENEQDENDEHEKETPEEKKERRVKEEYDNLFEPLTPEGKNQKDSAQEYNEEFLNERVKSNLKNLSTSYGILSREIKNINVKDEKVDINELKKFLVKTQKDCQKWLDYLKEARLTFVTDEVYELMENAKNAAQDTIEAVWEKADELATPEEKKKANEENER